MSSKTSRRCVSSTPGSDRLTRSKVKKRNQPHIPIGAIFRTEAASSVSARPSIQSKLQDGEQFITDYTTESHSSRVRGSTNIQEGIPSLPEFDVPILSQAENSSQGREAVNSLFSGCARGYETQADQQAQIGRKKF